VPKSPSPEQDSPKVEFLDPKFIDPHLLMLAVNRQRKMSKRRKQALIEEAMENHKSEFTKDLSVGLVTTPGKQTLTPAQLNYNAGSQESLSKSIETTRSLDSPTAKGSNSPLKKEIRDKSIDSNEDPTKTGQKDEVGEDGIYDTYNR
jgi:hypothetical protein